MKKLVSKLLGCLIAFTPVSSFNSNNYSHADIFSSSKYTSGVRVMTEQEFKKTCDYINDKINDYIDRYLETPLGKKFGYKIFNLEKNAGTFANAHEYLTDPYGHYKKNRKNLSLGAAEDFFCDTFNANLPSACCRDWVSYFDKNYFSKIDRKYAILSYYTQERAGHTLFLLCYYANNNKKIPRYVILDPMAQFSLTRCCRQIQSDIKNDEWVDSRYMN